MVAYTEEKVRLYKLHKVYSAARIAVTESSVRGKTGFKLPKHDKWIPLINDPTREAKTYRFTLLFDEVYWIVAI